ncbi:MAG: rhodanese-like domain-containing protein [Bacteroidia bacterium]
MQLNEILKSKNNTIIDVRTKAEFESGHVDGAINIPVSELTTKIDKIKNMPHPVVLCCASGSRSRQAHVYLSQHGVANTYNGGSWLEVNELKSQIQNY